MDRLTQEQQALNRNAIAAVTSDSIDNTQSGRCAGFQREITTNTLGLERSWAPGHDAISVGYLLASRGCEIDYDNDEAQIGDLLVWFEGHGPHGHIAMRVLGNRVAENSSAHVSDSGDARGFRPLALLDNNYRVFRLWQ